MLKVTRYCGGNLCIFFSFHSLKENQADSHRETPCAMEVEDTPSACASTSACSAETSSLTQEEQALLDTDPMALFRHLKHKCLEGARRLEEATSQLQNSKERIADLEQQNLQLQQQLQLEKFCLQRYGSDDKLIRYYTGFNSYSVLKIFFEYVRNMASSMQTVYSISNTEVSQAGRRKSLLLEDEMFMFLCRLWAGLQAQDLADRFHCSLATVSRKIITWANFLYFVLGQINIWLPRDVIKRKLPVSFKNSKYENTRVIIVCTEIKVQRPSSLVLNSQTFSSYKSANTLKCLIGIAPHGAVTFVSTLYTGCMSDVEITRLSGLLDLLQEGDMVMADKGFTIQKDCEIRKATLNIPPFLEKNKQFTPAQVADTQEIATLRIHVERAIQRIKENDLFKTILPLSMVGTATQLWTVATLLTLFQGPLIKEK